MSDIDETTARGLLDGIKVNLLDVAELIEQLWAGRGWLALGYATWPELVDAEIRSALPQLERAERRNAVAALASKGMSTRAIGSALGVNAQTVSNDLKAGAENSAPDPEPDPSPGPTKTSGLDGKKYTRRAKPKAEPDDEMFPSEWIDGKKGSCQRSERALGLLGERLTRQKTIKAMQDIDKSLRQIAEGYARLAGLGVPVNGSTVVSKLETAIYKWMEQGNV